MRCLLFLIFSLLTTHSWGSLISVTLLTRHGDRAALHVLPSDPHPPFPILGQLTPLGMRQHYLLGKAIRDRYSTFIPQNFSTSSIALRSTAVERTLQSAEALLQGLFPEGTGPLLDGDPALPHQIQVFPIHTVAKDSDLVLRSYDLCPNVDTLRDSMVYASSEWKAMLADNVALFARLKNISGYEPFGVEQFNWVADNVFCRREAGLGLYPGFDEELYNKTTELHHWIQVRKYPIDRKFTRPCMGKLIAEFVQNWETDIEKPAKAKRFRLYSAHDTTLIALMAGLKAPIEAPLYAAHALFELWGADDKHPSPYLKIFYSFEPHPIPGCEGDCPIATFKEITADLIAADGWERDDCGLVQPSVPLAPTIILASTSGVLLIALLISLFCRCRTHQGDVYQKVTNDDPVKSAV